MNTVHQGSIGDGAVRECDVSLRTRDIDVLLSSVLNNTMVDHRSITDPNAYPDPGCIVYICVLNYR